MGMGAIGHDFSAEPKNEKPRQAGATGICVAAHLTAAFGYWLANS
jgi:hypothetical protein